MGVCLNGCVFKWVCVYWGGSGLYLMGVFKWVYVYWGVGFWSIFYGCVFNWCVSDFFMHSVYMQCVLPFYMVVCFIFPIFLHINRQQTWPVWFVCICFSIIIAYIISVYFMPHIYRQRTWHVWFVCICFSIIIIAYIISVYFMPYIYRQRTWHVWWSSRISWWTFDSRIIFCVRISTWTSGIQFSQRPTRAPRWCLSTAALCCT